jgi:hypothetical protein
LYYFSALNDFFFSVVVSRSPVFENGCDETVFPRLMRCCDSPSYRQEIKFISKTTLSRIVERHAHCQNCRKAVFVSLGDSSLLMSTLKTAVRCRLYGSTKKIRNCSAIVKQAPKHVPFSVALRRQVAS